MADLLIDGFKINGKFDRSRVRFSINEVIAILGYAVSGDTIGSLVLVDKQSIEQAKKEIADKRIWHDVPDGQIQVVKFSDVLSILGERFGRTDGKRLLPPAEASQSQSEASPDSQTKNERKEKI